MWTKGDFRCQALSSDPLMITLSQEERIRRYAWWGFLSSMLLTLALSYLIFFHFLPDNLGKTGPIRAERC